MAYSELGIAYCRLGDFKKAVEYLELSLEITKEMGDTGREGMTYINLGVSYGSLGDFKKAVDCLECAAKTTRAVGNISAEGTAYSNLGSAYRNLGDFKKAIDCHERSLEIAKKVGDKSSEGHVYGNLGNDYRSRGDFKKAIEYFERSLEIAKETGDIEREGNAYSNLGNTYGSLGDIKKALDYHERHLAIVKQMGDVVGEGVAYGNLGLAYDGLGDFKKAVHYHECSLKIAKKVGNLAGEGNSYGSLASTYDNMGDFKNAIPYHERSLEIAKKVGDVAGEAKSYCNLGVAWGSIGDFKTAIDCYERSMKIAKEVGALDVEGNVYCNLGIAYGNLGDFKTAKDCHERSLEIVKQLGEVAVEGNVYSNLGNAYYNLGDFESAIENHQHALEILQKVGDTAGEGRVYSNLGDAHYSLGAFQKAIEYHDRDLQIAKDVGDIASEGNAYGNLGKIYHSLEDFKKAMDFHERHLEIAKEVEDKVQIGTSLYNIGAVFQSLGSFDESVDYYRHSVATFNDVRRLLEFKDEWKMSLRNLHQSVYVSLWRLLAKQEKIVEALLSAEQGRAQALNDLMELKYGPERTEADSGKESGESADDVLSWLPLNTVFIALEETEVIFWVLQKGKNVQLRRKQISEGDVDANTAVQSLMLNTQQKIGVRSGIKCDDRSLDMKRDENNADESSSDGERGIKSLTLQKKALSKLYETIISPIEDLLLDNEVVFVPEGPLCLAPFSAFVDSNSEYLCESFKIRLIPSLTSLKLISDCPTDYHCKTGALIVGYPWVHEVRYRGKKLKQLPSAREEAQVIGRIVHTDPLIGEEATKNEVLKRLSSVALVHIAAHGRMETGEIALAPNPTQTSQKPAEADYLLTMTEVLSVHMQAQLVVLSCCHSAKGEIKAEGVVGIARAFLGAGARSVLVSLWAIDDKATLEFMKRFYQHLVENKSASEAVNQAMNSMRESEEFGEVKHWAPFVLIGDDVTRKFAKHK